MNAHLSQDDRTAWILGFANPEEIVDWSNHLETCETCRLAMELDRTLLASLKETDLAEAPARRWREMVHHVLEEVHAAPAGPQGTDSKPAPTRFRFWFWRAAAVVLVFLIGYHFGSNHNRIENRIGGQLIPQHMLTESPPPVRSAPVVNPSSSGMTLERASTFLMVKADDYSHYGVRGRVF